MRPRVLVLTDRHQLPSGRGLVDTVADCAAAGLQAVVLRELDLAEGERVRLAAELARTGVRVVAARSRLPDTAGVHLAASQPAAASGWHGRSCHDDEEVRRAVAGGAAYLAISPVAASASKPGHGPALGTDGVRRAVQLAQGTPVLALGGVDARNAADLRAAGAHGVAVMGAVMRAADPAETFRRIHQEVA